MNGARGRSNNYLLDGTDMKTDIATIRPSMRPECSRTPATILPIDAISEMRVLSNFKPEFGRNGGAIVNIVTKSGTNALHGDVFEYFRNNALMRGITLISRPRLKLRSTKSIWRIARGPNRKGQDIFLPGLRGAARERRSRELDVRADARIYSGSDCKCCGIARWSESGGASHFEFLAA